MRVLIINGQNHKGSTYHIGRTLAEKVTSGEGDIKEVFLPNDMPYFCTGCTACFMKDEKLCPHYSEMKPITDMMDQADVLILTSPVYVYHATGSMKAFLDHLGYRWMVHRPEESMFKKQAVVISTAAGGGMRSTCKDMLDSCFYWGVARTYKFGIAVNAVSWDEVKDKKRRKIDYRTSAIAERIRKRTERTVPGLKTRLWFSIMRHFNSGEGLNPADAAYWKEKGWVGSKRPWK